MKNIGKIFFGIMSIILIVFVITVYTQFNGNPISKFITKIEIQKYLAQTYPNTEVKIEKMYYNFKFSGYGARAVAKTDPEINFNVSKYGTGYIVDDYMSRRVEKQLEGKILPLVEKHIPEVERLNLSVYVDEDEDKDENIVYSKEDFEGVIFLSVKWKGEGITKEEFVDRCVAVRDEFMDSDYKISDYFFSYDWKGEVYRSFMISLREEQVNWSKEQILNSDIVHYDSEEKKLSR